jgi:hypothetical protein
MPCVVARNSVQFFCVLIMIHLQAECLRLLVNAQKSSAQLLQEPPSWPDESLILSTLDELRTSIQGAAHCLQGLVPCEEQS